MILNLLIAIVVLAPLPFGCNRPWAWNLCAVLIGLLMFAHALAVLQQTWRGGQLPHLPEFKSSLLLFLLVAFWVVYQASGLPPVAWHHPLWQSASAALRQPLPGAISLNPEQSLGAFMRLLSYVLVFFLALQHCRSGYNARKVFRALAWGGCSYAVYGLVVHFGNFSTVLWYPKWSSFGDVTGTFINRNNFATYTGLTLLCTLALLLDDLSWSAHYDFSGFLGMQRLLEMLISRSWLPLLMLATAGSALILSHSRGGFLSTLLATLALLAVLNVNRQSRHVPVLLGLLSACLLALLVFLSGGQGLVDRLDTLTLEGESRDEVYRLLLKAIAGNPWLGTGYGTFEEGFRLYKDAGLAALRYEKAHNTYLENMFELGVPAALLLCAAIARPALTCLTGVFKRRRHWSYPAAGFAATVLVGAHACVDFSLQIPAVAMAYALLLGAACAQAFPSAARSANQ